jgi:hypothetical protein
MRIPTLKVMLFGIALIVFSNSFLKGAVMYGDWLSIIGLSLCIVGLLKADKQFSYFSTEYFYKASQL